MLANFSAGHSLSDFIFDLSAFENSLYTHYLFSPSGLAMPGYVFTSRLMQQHFERAHGQGVAPIILAGLRDGTYVPFLNGHLRDRGGFHGLLSDLLQREARGVDKGAYEVLEAVAQAVSGRTKYIPDDRNYGLKNEEIVKSSLGKIPEDEEFLRYWEKPFVRALRTSVLEDALERSQAVLPDGNRDVGLKVAKVVDAVASYCSVEVDGTAFSVPELLQAIPDPNEQADVGRFMKIICFLFNDAISWALEAKPNWPLQDVDFVRFHTPSGYTEDNLPTYNDFVLEYLELPTLEVFRMADEKTLRQIREVAQKRFFPVYESWAIGRCSGAELRAALIDYGERIKEKTKGARTSVHACVVDDLSTSSTSHVVVSGLSIAASGAAGAVASVTGSGLIETAAIVGSAGLGPMLAAKGVYNVLAFRVANRTRISEVLIGRHGDITLTELA